MVNFPKNVPLLDFLGRGSNGGFYKCKLNRNLAGGSLKMLIAHAERESTDCDYPHVIIEVSGDGVVFDYCDDYHFSPSAGGQRFGRNEVKKLAECSWLIPAICQAANQDRKALLSILGSLI
jgi:hypothetical protein